MLPSGPKRLGGDTTIMVALSPIQAAAMAAERRLQDEIWCGSQSAEVFEEGESSNDVTKDLLDVGQSTGCSRPDNGSKLNHDKVHNAEEHAMWECGVCTLLNPSMEIFIWPSSVNAHPILGLDRCDPEVLFGWENSLDFPKLVAFCNTGRSKEKDANCVALVCQKMMLV
ncbi:hypothetical protein GH714_023144 [Hevea brasiliensis]|uniref:Uncharacterized protein n=1 Tax=Hevea brasiliensis TaxID=3981 RepID=A0A6A6KKX8_HEVBR|nr:hypothetical protein GH714_023144 [Hevea brasiliensis]